METTYTTTTLFSIDCEGADGATTWTESVNGLTPVMTGGVEIDTDEYNSGASSLLWTIGHGGQAICVYIGVPDVEWSNFTVSFKFMYHDLSTTYAAVVVANDFSNIAKPTVQMSVASNAIGCYIMDAEGNDIVPVTMLTAIIAPDIWHTVRVSIVNTTATFTVDSTSYSYSIPAVWTGTSFDMILGGIGVEGEQFWIDDITITSTVVSQITNIIPHIFEWKDVKGSGPWDFSLLTDKNKYNDGNRFALRGNPVWETDFGVIDRDINVSAHRPGCGYWYKYQDKQMYILNFEEVQGSLQFLNEVTNEYITSPHNCLTDRKGWRDYGSGGSLKVGPLLSSDIIMDIPVPNYSGWCATCQFSMEFDSLPTSSHWTLGGSYDSDGLTLTLFGILDITAFFDAIAFDTEEENAPGAIFNYSSFTSVFVVGKKTHVAIVISEIALVIYIDGFIALRLPLIESGTHVLLKVTKVRIENTSFGGWIDDLLWRLDGMEVTAEALWSEEFTPPTKAPVKGVRTT